MTSLSLVLSLVVTVAAADTASPAPLSISSDRYAAAYAEAAHALVAPEVAGFRARELFEATNRVEEAIRRGSFPGAAVAIGRQEKVVVERGMGTLDWYPGSPAVDPDRTVLQTVAAANNYWR